jgi:hypothetical protein
MKTIIFNPAARASKQSCPACALGAAVTAAFLLMATADLRAGIPNGVLVGSLSGGGASPFYGYVEGNPVTSTDAKYHTPIGLALDSSGEYLFVADRDNNAIRALDLVSASSVSNFTYTFAPIPGYTPSGTITNPVGVALDADDDVYVLNRGNGKNGSVVAFDPYGESFTRVAWGLTNANAMALDGTANVYVTASNILFKIAAGTTNRSVVATVTNAGACLQGVVVMENGMIAVCDSGRHGIYLISASGVVSTNTGFNGAGDNNNIWQNTPNLPVTKASAMFNQPMGLAKAGNNMLVVADYGNNRVKVVDAFGTVTNLYGVHTNLWCTNCAPGQCNSYPGWYDGPVTVPDACGDVEARLPNGVLLSPNGTVYVTEDYYHLIRIATGTTLPPPPPWPPSAPAGLTAITNCEQITLTWAPSSGATNYNVKRSTSSTTNYAVIASTSATSYTDTNVLNGTTYYYVVSAVNAGGEGPNSAPVSATPPPPPAPVIVTVVTNYGQVALTWSTVPCPGITYNVRRSPSSGGPYTIIVNTASTSYTDTGVLNGSTYYYVVSAVGSGGEGAYSAQVVATVPLPPVPDPQIGYVDFPATSTPVEYTSVFHPVSSFVFNNDAFIVIEGAAGSQTFYTFGPTPASGSIPDPTSASASAPVGYQDGMSPSQVAFYAIAQTLPDLTLKAIGEKTDGSPNSAIVQARFQFITANPIVNGDNAAQFTVSDLTTNAEMWYTTDGSTPTNAAPSVGPIASGRTLSLQFSPSGSNLTFQVRAFRTNYQASAVVPVVFSATNFIPNSISFGFASGEASSDFVGSPGQTFYAPVTLSPLPGVKMYSLQFNLTVTNGGPNPGPPVFPGAYSFQSFLVKKLEGSAATNTLILPGGGIFYYVPPSTVPQIYQTIPPYMYSAYASDPPPTNQIVTYDGSPFVDMVFTNTAFNLLGVGWLERIGQTNLYDTIAQTLITFSEPHDTLFTPDLGKVVAGGYSFQIPPSAAAGQTYEIRIGQPSATADGVGAPGFDVYIATPTNGSLRAGAMNSIKHVTVGQRQYLVGDSAPFRWFNAGDFGDTNLDNSDVMQVFQSAVYKLDSPLPGSDFLDGMDSCGGLGVFNPATGYYTYAGPLSVAQQNALFDGNDTTINQIAFGDGVLDVCDVYVTFRRSLDPSLSWFFRFWTNGVRAAVDPAPGASANNSLVAPNLKATTAFLTNPPCVNFAATDVMASAGQTVQIPITANIAGSYPLRVLMLNLSVVPLDGSPALTSAVQFTPNVALGTPAISSSIGNGNYAATWLNSAIAGLTGNATIGTLTVTVPAGATSSAAYAVHFDHASASPNGIASFPKQTLTGLITLSSRNTSSYKDGIPDSWRLRWFGTIYNALSAASADACGDGINNWEKYVAGTDPTDPKAYPYLLPTTPPLSGAAAAIHWPSISGKQYVIERSSTLFPGSWTAIATNIGTGTVMEFDDSQSTKASFYRVRILP